MMASYTENAGCPVKIYKENLRRKFYLFLGRMNAGLITILYVEVRETKCFTQ